MIITIPDPPSPPLKDDVTNGVAPLGFSPLPVPPPPPPLFGRALKV
jgi:hypothetical protein